MGEKQLSARAAKQEAKELVIKILREKRAGLIHEKGRNKYEFDNLVKRQKILKKQIAEIDKLVRILKPEAADE